MLKLLALISIILSSVVKCSSQTFRIDENYNHAYSLLLDLKFEEASKQISSLKSSDRNNLSPLYLEDLSDFLFIVVTENQLEFNARKELRSQRLKSLNKLSDESPYKLLAEGEIHLHWAFSKMRFGEYLSGARDINKAFHALEKNMEKFPDFLPTYKSMGLLHTLIGTVPDNYRWATNLMGVDGTIEQGISEMETVISKSDNRPEYANLRKETLFLLSFLHINLLNDKAALVAYKSYVEQETGPLMTFANASLLKEAGNSDQAISVIESSQESLSSFPYLNFLLGELKLARMDSDADLYFRSYIKSFKGKSYLKSSYQKLAWHALLVQEDENQYHDYLSQVGSVGNTMLDEDKSAQKEFESEEMPNEVLLRARLQFDGGYFLQALKTLVSSESAGNSADERLEFTYRLARIHDELGNDNDAISYYEMTMKNGSESKRYFAANAALKLGLLYERTSKYEAALKAFNACSEFKNSEYKNSILQKAKAGILRLED